MIGSDERGGLSGRWLAVAVASSIAWVAWSLVRHPGFQPSQTLRTAAPLLALALGGGFTRLVALVRARADAEREFDRGGKALFMGFVMVGATLVAWLLVSQAVPAAWTAATGVAATEPGVVSTRPPLSTEGGCPRLVVTSADLANGAVPHPMDECVDPIVWQAATEGGPVALRLVRGALGAELVGVAAR